MTEALPDNRCPSCGKAGSLVLDQTTQTRRCSACKKTIKSKLPRPPVTKAPIPEDEIVRDHVRYKGTDGRMHVRQVPAYHVPKLDDVPVLDHENNLDVAKRIKWVVKHEDRVQKERRRARDSLLRQGYVIRPLRFRTKTGGTKTVRVMVPPTLSERSDEELRSVVFEVVKKLYQED